MSGERLREIIDIVRHGLPWTQLSHEDLEALADAAESTLPNVYTLFWRDGKRELVTGPNVAAAMTSAGYGAGALRALDFQATGDNHEWRWDAKTREWNRIAEQGGQAEALRDAEGGPSNHRSPG